GNAYPRANVTLTAGSDAQPCPTATTRQRPHAYLDPRRTDPDPYPHTHADAHPNCNRYGNAYSDPHAHAAADRHPSAQPHSDSVAFAYSTAADRYPTAPTT